MLSKIRLIAAMIMQGAYSEQASNDLVASIIQLTASNHLKVTNDEQTSN